MVLTDIIVIFSYSNTDDEHNNPAYSLNEDKETHNIIPRGNFWFIFLTTYDIFNAQPHCDGALKINTGPYAEPTRA